jgi:predicted PhzF superfamily epimerase YddE/YHI9
MTLLIVHVDAFTDAAFAGNPAAVCLLPEARDDGWMQRVASEMNLSETAFLRSRDPDAPHTPDTPHDTGFDLRWFTPAVEVDLCGHATLASAHVLWESGRLSPAETARFHTRSGLLTAVRRGEWIEMDFPATPEEPATPPPGLIEGLGAPARYVGRNRFDYLVELDGEGAVRRLRPDLGRLAKVPARGIIATGPSAAPGYDFVSRFFAPAVGIDEDPVTGSAHCCLAPFWGRRLGKSELLARQISARGGVVRMRLEGDRVHLGGQAVTVFTGELLA